MRWSSSSAVLALAMGILCTHPTAAGADEAAAHARARTLLMLRILAYDHGLKQRAGDRLTVLVAHHASDAGSLRRRDEIVESFNGLEKIKVAGLPVAVATVAVGEPSLLAATVRATRPAAIIVCPGLGDQIAVLRSLARSGTMLSFAPSAAELKKGLSVAIVADDDRDRIAINLAASRAEGVKFDAVLLEMATIVDGDAR